MSLIAILLLVCADIFVTYAAPSQIGLVSQEPILFSITIRKNVEHGLVGTPHQNLLPEEKLWLVRETCIKANVDGFISELPCGYAVVGECGLFFPEARSNEWPLLTQLCWTVVFYSLMRATSAFDMQSEGVVQNALGKATAGMMPIHNA